MNNVAAPKIDVRRYEDILLQIEQLASVYTPDWRFNTEHPDAGTSLACLFAQQLFESIERFNDMPLNHRTTFYNKLGASCMPASPASGAVCFSLSGENADGSLIEKDFKLFTPIIDNEGTRYVFETQKDIFVTPVRLKGMIYTHRARDRICVWDDQSKPFAPLTSSEDIQEHKLAFKHEYINGINKQSRLYIHIKSRQDELWCERLSDPSLASWTLISKDKSEILTCIRVGKRLRLCGFSGDLREDVCIELSIHEISMFEGLSMEELLIETEGEGFTPNVCCNGEEQKKQKIYPFGKDFAKYDEVSFMCNNVLSQKGALITLEFTMGFEMEETEDIPIPLQTKFIIPKKRLVPPPKPEVLIKEVVWEYFNGIGFKPLMLNKASEHIFAGIDEMGNVVGNKRYKIEFVCPDDIAELLTGAQQGYCIRARIKEISNAYKRPAKIFSPFMIKPHLGYKYPCASPVVNGVLKNNVSKTSWLCRPDFPFCGFNQKQPSLYLRFDAPLKGDIGILVKCAGEGMNIAEWAYWSNGTWQRLPVENQTASFTKTGMIFFTVKNEMSARELYGSEGYWMRIIFDNTGDFIIENVYMNAVPVIQCETVHTEAFSLDDDACRIQLKHKNILDETVYVNEKGRLREQFDGDEDNWVCRKEASPNDGGGYHIDRAHGIISFPKGIANLSKTGQHSVKVRYRHGGGSGANLCEGMTLIPSLSVGFVNKAFNPLPFTGGTEQETTDGAIKRLSRRLRHGNYPVTAGDYEDLAQDRDIAGVRCFTEEEGEVTLVMVMKDYTSVHGFANAKQRLSDKLIKLIPMNVRLCILPPDFVTVTVQATLKLNGGEASVYEAIQRICDPISHFHEYGLGTLPDTGTFTEAILSLPRVERCLQIFVRYSIGNSEIETPPPFALPCNGNHVITVR